MTIFGKFKAKVFKDPLLGDLRSRRPCHWDGSFVFEGEEEAVGISLPGDESGPSGEGRQSLLDFHERYADLRPTLDTVLFQLYGEHVEGLCEEDLSQDFPRISNSKDASRVFALVSIEVAGDSGIELTYCFSDSADDTIFLVRLVGDVASGKIYGD
jgi:hypothetical protein